MFSREVEDARNAARGFVLSGAHGDKAMDRWMTPARLPYLVTGAWDPGTTHDIRTYIVELHLLLAFADARKPDPNFESVAAYLDEVRNLANNVSPETLARVMLAAADLGVTTRKLESVTDNLESARTLVVSKSLLAAIDLVTAHHKLLNGRFDTHVRELLEGVVRTLGTNSPEFALCLAKAQLLLSFFHARLAHETSWLTKLRHIRVSNRYAREALDTMWSRPDLAPHPARINLATWRNYRWDVRGDKVTVYVVGLLHAPTCLVW